MLTVDILLHEGTSRLREAGSETPRLDAELLLGAVLEVDRTRVLAYADAAVGDGQAERFRELIERRAAGEPVAYIRGLKEFMGLAFAVDPRALIPRPETESLVEIATAEIAERLIEHPPFPGTRLRIADIGTGSGAVAVSIAVALRRRRMLDEVAINGTDVSEEALRLAALNVVSHAVADRVTLIRADLLPPGADVYDVIAANLPYVRGDAIPGLPIATSFEPVLALDGGPDGLAVIRRALALLPKRLGHDGVAFFEIGSDQAGAMTDLVTEVLPGWQSRIESDLAGAPRVARVEPGA